jgi:hypothetical protein
MEGDDEVRLCRLCNLHVFDLVAMNREEAAVLLAADSNSMCLRYYRRADGTVLTKDCPIGVSTAEERRSKTRRRLGQALLGAGMTAAGAAVFWPVQAMGRVAGPVARRASLGLAAGYGDLVTMRQLLDDGIDPNSADSSGMTPMMHAAMRGQREAVQLLLDRGADPALRDESGGSALDVARDADAQEIVQLLTSRLPAEATRR